MVHRRVSNLAVRATRISRMLPGTRALHTTRLSNFSKPLCLATSPKHAESYHPNLLTRSFTVSCTRHEADTVVRVPTMAESITEGTLTQFSKQVGDFVEQDEDLATIETDKIDVSVNAPHPGIIKQLLVAEGDTVTVDQAIAELRPEKKHSVDGASDSANSALNHPESHIQEKRESSAASVTTELPATITTKSNRKKDENTTKRESSHTGDSSSQESQSPKQRRGENRVCPKSYSTSFLPSSQSKHANTTDCQVKMTRIRQKTAEHLKESQNTAAFLTTFNEVDMSKIIEFRKKNKETVLPKYGVKLGFMGAMAKASVLALKEIPAVNASVENGDTIVYRDYVDLSVAASIPKGLVTPVLRNIESMSIVDIEKGISELVAKVSPLYAQLTDVREHELTFLQRPEMEN